jgi:hypothetical protein
MIDTLTGAVSYSVEGRDREIWRTIQKGTDENDHVLTFHFLSRDYDELIVIVSIIAAAAFSLGFFTGFAVRASISHRRRRYSRR